MIETGTVNAAHRADSFGLRNLSAVHWNLTESALYEAAIARGEARIDASGALVAETGTHTGRSPKDKFTVRDAATEDGIWWDNNPAMTREAFDLLLADMRAHAEGKEIFAQDLRGGADPRYQINVRVYVEKAWHALFIRHLLRRPDRSELDGFVSEMTILDLPSFKADPARYGVRSETVIACDLTRKIVLVAGSAYAGEMKKSVFTFLNYLLPEQGVMPMHCSANVGAKGDAAIFFGLSGTGKTTLSSDKNRMLIGDDEHGWGGDGIFNFEGGCYAKTINLSREAEPEIYEAVSRFPTVLENVVIDPVTRRPDFADESKTENTRGAYPLDFIPNASPSGLAGHPKNIIMLTADAFGVMPPIARLSPAQAMYHFLSGYTATVAGTERGVTEPKATFSTCFAHPFLPRHPSVYGELLKRLIAEHGVDCWLVNTGWTGGIYGIGRRMPIQVTRALLNAVLDGSLRDVGTRTDPYFGFSVPTSVPGVPPHILHPFKTWQDKAGFDATARRLVEMFRRNFEQFETHVDAEVRAAAPAIRLAAE